MPDNHPSQTLDIQQVPVSHAWHWIANGFRLFKANPAMWIILLVLYLAIMIPLSMLPVIGSVLSTLLAPVFAAGMMWGCQAMMRNQDLEINHLFEGFKHNTSQLVAVGGIYMLSLLLVAVVVVLTLDAATVELLIQGKDLSTEQADAMTMPLLLALLFVLPVLMAYWFAPVLAGLHDLTAIEAMKLSFNACFKNMLPFFLYGLIFMVLLIIAIIPFGIGLIVVVPMMMTSLYTSYADVFGIEQQ
jgi:uncharacterized membrane protein